MASAAFTNGPAHRARRRTAPSSASFVGASTVNTDGRDLASFVSLHSLRRPPWRVVVSGETGTRQMGTIGRVSLRAVSSASWGMMPSCFWRAKISSRSASQPASKRPSYRFDHCAPLTLPRAVLSLRVFEIFTVQAGALGGTHVPPRRSDST